MRKTISTTLLAIIVAASSAVTLIVEESGQNGEDLANWGDACLILAAVPPSKSQKSPHR